MVTTLNLLLNAVIVIGLLSLVWVAYKLVTVHGAPQTNEIALRVLSCAMGFLIYVGSRATGLSIPDLMLSAITQGGFFNIFLKSVLLPAGSGILVSWFCISRMKDSGLIATRMTLILMVFVLFTFVDAYAVAYDLSEEVARSLRYSGSKDNQINALLAPNLVFTLTVGLYATLFLKPTQLART